MNVTPEQAQDSLNEIRQVAGQMRKSIAASGASGHLMLWGAVWFVCFLLTNFWPQMTGRIWLVGDAIGAVGSVLIGIQSSRSSVKATDSNQLGWRLFWLWLMLFVYVALWMSILRPDDGVQICAFTCTAIMFLYVVMGLWLEAYFLLWLGLAVTALTVFGFHMFPGHFYLWMAPTGGGSLFGVGYYIHANWK